MAYPERYRLSSGAELVSGWIPNRMYPSLSITTLFHGNEFKNTSYNLSQNLLDKYDSGALTLHELVNEPLHSKSPPEESRRPMSPLAQTVHLPICRGMITTKTNTKDRNSKVGGKTSPHTQ